MLFQRHILDQIAAGRVTLAFRRWRKPTVRQGGTLRTEVGVLAIESITEVAESDLSEREAIRAGYSSLSDLHSQLAAFSSGTLYRISFALAGPDPRIALRETPTMTAQERSAVRERLAKFDSSSRFGPWTHSILQLIEQNPGVRAQELAEVTKFDKEWLKTHIRKLKDLGLTESLLPGYRLSPRGQFYLNSNSTGNG